MDRQLVSSGSPWESVVGYSRAVRVGDMVFVAATTGTDETGRPADPNDIYRQTHDALAKIERALAEAGASMADVVRSTIYVTDISRWQDVGRAHAEFFGDVRPAATMVEVSRLIAPDLLVEIAVDAVIARKA